MQKPKFSFVVTARNDNYAGNLLNRSSTFVRVLSHLANKYKLQSEIIFVEYNPVPDKKYLFQELPISATPYLKIRGIVVPKEFHDSVRENNIPLLEYIAKNIGIRRAEGDYIIATNPDIIFSDHIIKYFKEGNLDQLHFYRADRNDIRCNNFPLTLPPEKIIRKCALNVTKILYSPRTHYISYLTWINRFIHDRRFVILSLCPIFNYRYKPNRSLIYENASGDFTLAHRSVWEKARGYDQTPHNLHHDGLMLYVLQALGYKQEVLPYPIYHMHHELGRAGRPGIEFEKYREVTRIMQETSEPNIANGANWGYIDEKFTEVISPTNY